MYVCAWEREKGREKWERPSVLEVVRGDSGCPLRSTHAVEGCDGHILSPSWKPFRGRAVPFSSWCLPCLTQWVPDYYLLYVLKDVAPALGSHRPCHLHCAVLNNLASCLIFLIWKMGKQCLCQLKWDNIVERQISIGLLHICWVCEQRHGSWKENFGSGPCSFRNWRYCLWSIWRYCPLEQRAGRLLAVMYK